VARLITTQARHLFMACGAHQQSTNQKHRLKRGKTNVHNRKRSSR